MRARRRQLRRMDRGRFIHRDDAKRLQPPRTLQDLNHDPRPLIGHLKAIAAQTCHMEENVRQPVVGHDEAVSLGYVEPLDDAAELDNARNFITDIADRSAISADTNSWPLGSNAIRRSHDPARRSPPAPSAKWRPPNPSDKLRISLGSAVQSDK